MHSEKDRAKKIEKLVELAADYAKKKEDLSPLKSAKPKLLKKATDLIVDEKTSAKKIGFQDYKNFLSFGPGWFGFFMFFLIVTISSLAQLGTSFTLAHWTTQSLEEQQSSFYYPGLFIGSIVFYIVMVELRAIIVFWIVHTSSTNLHNYVVKRVLRANILFFDSNPIGRIVTRFSKDVMVIDFIICVNVIFISMGVFRTVTVCITIGAISPPLFIGILIGVLPMWYYLTRGNGAMQYAQKLDGEFRGPVHSTFAFLINGLTTIRVFNRAKYFKQDMNNTQEKCANASFCFNVVNRWIGLRLDMVCVFFTIITIVTAFL